VLAAWAVLLLACSVLHHLRSFALLWYVLDCSSTVGHPHCAVQVLRACSCVFCQIAGALQEQGDGFCCQSVCLPVLCYAIVFILYVQVLLACS
jgi:hypothetical protein